MLPLGDIFSMNARAVQTKPKNKKTAFKNLLPGFVVTIPNHARMFRNYRFAISLTSVFLLVFALFAPMMPLKAAWAMFALSPFLVIWMVYNTLRDTSAPPRDLAPGEHWGYVDRDDLRPQD
jgi:hypothetical protein